MIKFPKLKYITKTVLRNKKINNLIRQTIIETIQEVLRDPDYGLALREGIKRRLRKRPKIIIPFEEIKEKYR